MANPFDQFDAPAQRGNPFDQFDAPSPHSGVDWGGVAGRIASWPGRIAGTVAEGLMAGPKLMGDVMEGRTDPMSKEAIGRSFEAATAATPLAPGAGAARMIAPASKAARVAAPEREELAESWREGFKELKNKNVPLRADVVEDLSNTLRDKLNEDFHPRYNKDVYDAINDLKNPVGPNSSAKEVYQVRTHLNNIMNDNKGKSNGAAAKVALEHIDDYLSNVPGFAETAKRTRGDYRAGMASDRVTEAAEKARAGAAVSGSGANTANKLRQAIKSLRYNKKGNWTPAEQELMDAIINGGKAENIARLVSKLGPRHPLSGWGTAIAADFAGGGGAATAGLGVGHLAQWFSERAPAKKIEALDEAIRANSPLGRSRAMAGPPPTYRQPYGVPPTGAAAFPAAAALTPGAGSPLGGGLDALSPVSSAQAAENPIRGGKPPADEALADKPTHGGALALPELGGGKGAAKSAPSRKPSDVDLREEMNKLLSESSTARPAASTAAKPPDAGLGKAKAALGTPAEGGVAKQSTMGDVFSSRIKDLMTKIPDTAPHQGKVAIGELYDAYRKAFPREYESPRTFGFRLVNAAKARNLDMARLDMPERLDPDLRLRSQTQWGDDTVHFVTRERQDISRAKAAPGTPAEGTVPASAAAKPPDARIMNEYARLKKMGLSDQAIKEDFSHLYNQVKAGTPAEGTVAKPPADKKQQQIEMQRARMEAVRRQQSNGPPPPPPWWSKLFGGNR